MTSSTRSSRPKPTLVVIAGPSGVGKTTLAGALVDSRGDLVLSVSATTRPARPSEHDGIDYHFMAEAEFDERVSRGGFLEHATVHGHRYGTPRDQVERSLRAGQSVVLEIDVQGARQVADAMPEALTIFIEPPSIEVLRARLTGRKTESPEAQEQRLLTALAEMKEAPGFDHRVVNDVLEDTLAQLTRILDASLGPDKLEAPLGPDKE